MEKDIAGSGKAISVNLTGFCSVARESPVCVFLSFATAPISPASMEEMCFCSFPCKLKSWPNFSPEPRLTLYTEAAEDTLPE